MELDYFDYLDLMQEDEQRFRIPKRILRDCGNPFELYDDEQFFSRYRFSKDGVMNGIFPLVKENFEGLCNRGRPLPAIIKLLAVLRYYATGSFQIDAGESHSMSQPSFSQLLKNASKIIARQLPRVIRFPDNLNKVKADFFKISKFPGVIGCIDCTHIPIQNPNRNTGEVFRNRKGNFSINVQVVSGPNGEIFDLVARWPGSAHDSRIFDNSSVKTRLENNALQGILLGDNGYGQKRYLFTPLLNPASPAEVRYNNAHKTTRTSVERTFGVLKRRFACLRRQLSCKVSTTLHIISACAVLHNIAVQYREHAPNMEDELHDDDDDDDDDDNHLHQHVNNQRGNMIRNAFILLHFT